MGVFENIRNRLKPGKEQGDGQPDPGGRNGSPYGRYRSLSKDEKERLTALLTPREYELFQLLLQGYTLRESAQQLDVKYSTANTHMSAVYRKLGVRTRAELIINYRDIS